jgi:PelA/Pel-15E family pectate lyase
VPAALLILFLAVLCPRHAAAEPDPSAQTVRNTMIRATTFMLDTVSHRGGFVWYYLPDFSRRWGELEASPTMVWVQPPGTATVGHVLLDAYRATGDALFLGGAKRVADALLAGQDASGGWNYMFDLAGEEALRHWYETVGANAWRLEEFHHYLDNATFDDGGTYETTLLLLRLYQQEHAEARHERGLRRALDFVLDSQYPIGAWPQRYPTEPNGPAPYASYLTFNDGVAANNIRLLLQAHRVLGEERLLRAARRGMDAFLALQRGAPQPGWALQYTLDLQPAPARSYEAAGLSPAATAGNIRQLMLFYEITGDSAFLGSIPAALDWLDSLRLPPELVHDGRTHPRVVELDSDRPLFIHRTGSNVVNGRYYLDDDPNHTVVHYPSTGRIDVAALRQRLAALEIAAPAVERVARHPVGKVPHYYISADTLGRVPGNQQRLRDKPVAAERAARIIAALNEQGYWPTELSYTTHPYRGPGPAEPAPGDYRSTWVGDDSDTSPFYLPEPRPVIALDTYIANMARLVRYLREADLAAQ